MRSQKLLLLLLLLSLPLHGGEQTRSEFLEEESRKILERSAKVASFYQLEEGEEIREITLDLLSSDLTKDGAKQAILAMGRRFFVFQYPSDGFQVKGTISFVPNPFGNPLLFYLRSGNRLFALMHPALDIALLKNFTVLSTAHRGGVSEGTDEFGGDEVNDIEHLLQYLPVLEEKLAVSLNPDRIFMLGPSRGGMEMFLALGRSLELQRQLAKAASLSGLLDMRAMLTYREDMKTMFVEEFGLILGENEEEWIRRRDPIQIAPNIRKDLPLLILQGTEDPRVDSEQARHMVRILQENGNLVEYLEVPGGNHCLINQPDAISWIVDWFEKNS